MSRALHRQEHDPGGHAGLGFRRLPEPPHTLEIDPDRMPAAVGLFERYALGNVSAAQLEAETGLAASRIPMILVNPIYNGWIRLYRRGRNGTRKPAPWRGHPPVSDELWARVEDVRRSKTRAGGPRRADRVDLLKGLIECVCGRRVRSDGTFADGRHRKLHLNPCADWGKRARLGDEVLEEPILAQLEGIELDDATMAAVVASLGSGPRPVAIDRARIDRQIRELALEHAAGRLEDAVYLERLHELRDAKENLERTSADGISSERAVAWLQALSATWRAAEVPAEKADLLHAIYERITVAGPEIMGVRLTAAAYAHGLALALPEEVGMARPTGVGRAITIYLPIEGRDDWLAAAERRRALPCKDLVEQAVLLTGGEECHKLRSVRASLPAPCDPALPVNEVVSCCRSGPRPYSPSPNRRASLPSRRSRRASQEGAGMPKIVVTAAVKDVEAWLKFKADMTAALSAVASDGSSYVAMDGSNQVASTWDVPDMEAFQTAQRSFPPELAAAAERAGMIPPVMIYIKK